MSLRNILIDVSSELGLDLSNADELTYHITKVNEAAKELYDSTDLPGSLREQLFQIDDTDTYQVAFPYAVDKIRAIRFYNTAGGNITLEDMRPRYHNYRWGTQRNLKYQIKQTNAPLNRNILNAAPLTFSLPQDEVAEANIVITVIGSTPTASRAIDTITILAGQNSATGLKHFEEVASIEKADTCDFDITITDVDDIELGIIPNHELRPNYTIVKIREDDYSLKFGNSYPLNTIEVLYKHRFIPFINYYDEFICPDCDKLIAWKFIEHYWAKKPGHDKEALLAYGKFEKVLKLVLTNDNLGKVMEPNRRRNRMFDAQELPHINDVSRFIQDPPQITYPEN